MLRRILFSTAAVLIGLAGIFLVLEATLQTGALALRREGRGDSHLSSAQEVRIACVGESTTYGKWPSQLEEILNREWSDAGARVINRGNVGILTDAVAERIGGWLDEDQPHLVITMLGINDEGNVLVYPRENPQPWLMEHLKSVKLFGLLWRSAFDVGVPQQGGGEAPFAEAHIDSETRSVLERHGIRRPLAWQEFRYSEAIDIQLDLIAVDPGKPTYHVGYLKGLVLHHDTPQRLDEFFTNEVGVDPSALNDAQRQLEIEKWTKRTGDRFAGLRLAASVARAANDEELERQLLDEAAADPDLAGLAWLRRTESASMRKGSVTVRQCLIRAGDALPDDYQWSLLLGEVSSIYEAHDLAAEHYRRAMALRPDLPISHEIVVLGWLANAYDQAGEVDRAAALRAQLVEADMTRFREFTRYYYLQVIDQVRARGVPVIAMQYPLLSVESLRKLLGYREDVTYLGNRANFEAALRDVGYRGLFSDSFAGSFGHLTDRGNLLIAENVADVLSGGLPESISKTDGEGSPTADPH